MHGNAVRTDVCVCVQKPGLMRQKSPVLTFLTILARRWRQLISPVLRACLLRALGASGRVLKTEWESGGFHGRVELGQE